MGEENIEFVVSLRGGTEAAGEVRKVKEAIAEAGGATRAFAGESAGAGGAATHFSSGLKRMAAGFIALGAGYKIYAAAKGAISFTKELAESSKTLTGATGLSIEQSSRYLGVADAMGVSSASLNVAFKSLSKQTEAQANKTHVSTGNSAKHRIAVINETMAIGALEKRLAKGTVTQSEYSLALEKIKLTADKLPSTVNASKTAFDKLGISQQWVKEHGKDFNDVILKVTERLKDMEGGPKKIGIENELFGRSWATLNPLLGEGSKHLEDVLGLAKKYGVELKGNVTNQLKELTAAQLESTLASEGLKIEFTKIAGPPLVGLLKGFARMKNFAREKNWPAFSKELGKVFTVAEKVVETFELRSIEGFGQIAPKMLTALWHGFERASLGSKALMLGLLARKFGLTNLAFSALGGRLSGSLAKGMAGADAKAALANVATKLGPIFGEAFVYAAAAYIGLELGKYLAKQIHVGFDPAKILKGEDPFTLTHPQGPSRQTPAIEAHNLREEARGKANFLAHPYKEAHADLAGPLGRPDPIVQKYHERFTGGHVHAHTPARIDLHSGGITPLAPGSLAQPIENVMVVDGKVLARAMRRQDLLSQAAGA